jgi:preprotein translocase subunit YajC
MNQMLMMMMMIMMKRRKKKKKTKMKTKHIQVTVNQMMMTTSKHKEHIEHVAEPPSRKRKELDDNTDESRKDASFWPLV